jgi:hypothetical protein
MLAHQNKEMLDEHLLERTECWPATCNNITMTAAERETSSIIQLRIIFSSISPEWHYKV